MSDEMTVCIVGIGACTTIGKTAPESAASARAGVKRFVQHPHIIDHLGKPLVVALASYIPKGLTWLDRLTALAAPALREACEPLSRVIKRPPRVPLFVGLPAERPTLTGSWWEPLIYSLREAAPLHVAVSDVNVFPCGHAGGLLAMEAACQRIKRGDAELALAGGCECYLARQTLSWLDTTDRLKRKGQRFGFIPGEAAGFCLLASERAATRRELPVMARVRGIGVSREESPVNTGLGLTRAICDALAGLSRAEKIDAVLCDQNGERWRADERGFTLLRLGKYFADMSAFKTPARWYGDVGAAHGPLCVSMTIAAAARGYAEGPLTLTWASSESGERGALLLEATMIEKAW
jgi:3-oxoacyl-[acyl-carrier-protein] synthase I